MFVCLCVCVGREAQLKTKNFVCPSRCQTAGSAYKHMQEQDTCGNSLPKDHLQCVWDSGHCGIDHCLLLNNDHSLTILHPVINDRMSYVHMQNDAL